MMRYYTFVYIYIYLYNKFVFHLVNVCPVLCPCSACIQDPFCVWNNIGEKCYEFELGKNEL